MEPQNIAKRYVSDEEPRDFWETLILLESKDRRDRYTVYGLLTFVFYIAPGIAALMVGFMEGASLSQPQIPLSALLVGTKASVIDLFSHNLLIVIVIFLGCLTLGIVTILVMMLNGMFIGYGVGYIAGVYGITASILAIAPHGVFEIPALWIAGIGSVRIVHMLSLFSSSARDSMKASPWDYVMTRRNMIEIGVLISIIFVLIGLAAVTEVYVTPWLVEKFVI